MNAAFFHVAFDPAAVMSTLPARCTPHPPHNFKTVAGKTLSTPRGTVQIQGEPAMMNGLKVNLDFPPE